MPPPIQSGADVTTLMGGNRTIASGADVTALMSGGADSMPFSRRGGMTNPAMETPEVFKTTNEVDAQGNPVVRDATADDAGRQLIAREENRTLADRAVVALPGIGPILDYFTDHPAEWLRTKVDEWGKAGPHAVVQGLTNLYMGNYAKGAHQVATGAAVTALPMVAPELIGAVAAAPAATIPGIVTGTAAATLAAPPAKKLAQAAGLTEDQAQLVEDAVGLGAGYAGAKVTPQNVATAGRIAISHVPGVRGVRTIGRVIDALGEAVAPAQAAQTAAEVAASESTAAAAPLRGPRPGEAADAYIERIITEGRAEGARRAAAAAPVEPPPIAAPAPVSVQREPAPVQPAPVPPARTFQEAAATVSPAPAPAPAPVVRPEPQPITLEALKAHYISMGLRPDIAEAMAQAVFKSSPGRFVPVAVEPPPPVQSPAPAPVPAGPPSPAAAQSALVQAAARGKIPLTKAELEAMVPHVVAGHTPDDVLAALVKLRQAPVAAAPVAEGAATRPAQVDVAGNVTPSRTRRDMSATPGLSRSDVQDLGLNPDLPIKKLTPDLVARIMRNRAQRAALYRSDAAYKKSVDAMAASERD